MVTELPCLPAYSWADRQAAVALGARPYLCRQCCKWHRDYTHRLPDVVETLASERREAARAHA
ncbi:MAG: hypothetical protein EPN91_09395 [Salinibacterium sp.]|nr:MAG: hypothetical protein EPN91_09395 [Salinibacterium sp.]